MNKNGQIEKAKTQVARPLRTLVPLIKRDLHDLENSGKPYRYSVGEKLVEAKKDHEGLKKAGGWIAWLKKNFIMSLTSADRFMEFYESELSKARRRGIRRPDVFETQEDEAEAYTKFSHKREGKKRHRRDLGSILSGIDADLYAQKLQDRKKEIDLRRDLAEKLIEAGFRLLAKELHPDKGGTSELMRRLNAVREALLRLLVTIGSEVAIFEE
jgi:hypothetical protein